MISLTVSDMDRSLRFYDRVLAILGLTRQSHFENLGLQLAGYGIGDDLFFWLGAAEMEEPCAHGTVPKGQRISLTAASPREVDVFYRVALSAGGASVWAPSCCPEHGAGFYAAQVVDPSGHIIEVVTRLDS